MRGRHGVLNATSHHHNRGVMASVVCLHERARGAHRVRGHAHGGAGAGAGCGARAGDRLARQAGDGGRRLRGRWQHRRDGAMASKKLTEDLKQSFVVENRIGAGGALAAAYVAQAAPDGYTLFFAAAPQIAIVPQLQKVNYDPKNDLTPVSVFGTGPFILGINSSIPAKTIAEFVAYAKTRKINYGSSGAGSVAHLAGALFVNRAGLDAVHVPFRGSGQVTAALLGGQIDMFFGNASDLVPQAENGKVTLLGVATPQRMKQLPKRADDRRNLSLHVARKLERVPRSGQ